MRRSSVRMQPSSRRTFAMAVVSALRPLVPVAAILALALLVLDVSDAAAHAVLVRTDPAAGSRNSQAPSHVRLFFNEPVEPVFNSIRVLDASGARRDTRSARVGEDNTVVEVPLEPLTGGAYSVLWRITSVDGHQITGHFGFGIGVPPPTDAAMQAVAAAPEDPRRRVVAGTIKLLGMSGLVVGLGAIGFLLAVFAPARARAVPPDTTPATGSAERRLVRVALIGGTVMLVAECLGFVGQAARLAGVPFFDGVSPAVVSTVLTGTNFGLWWTVRFVAGTLLFGCFLTMVRRSAAAGVSASRTLNIAMAALGALVLITYPLGGHARAVGSTVWPVVSDWVHLIAAVVWAGGLFSLALALSAAGRHGATTPAFNTLGARFSRIALASILLLVVTGAYNTWLHVPSWSAFGTTAYGRVLVAKVLLLVPILLIAFVNRRWALSGIATAGDRFDVLERWTRRLQRLVTGEAALVVPLLILAVILTMLPPATSALSGPVQLTETHDGHRITLRVAPHIVGLNRAMVTVRDAQGAPVQPRRVTVYVRCLEMDMGMQSFDAKPAADASYEAAVAILMAGRSAITVEISPPSGDTYTVEFETYTAS